MNANEIVIFRLKDQSAELSVKLDFFKYIYFWQEKEGRASNLEEKIKIMSEESMYHLINTYKITNYLHSETGPAIINLVSGEKLYFVNGKQIPKEKADKIIFDSSFNDYMDNFLKGE